MKDGINKLFIFYILLPSLAKPPPAKAWKVHVSVPTVPKKSTTLTEIKSKNDIMSLFNTPFCCISYSFLHDLGYSS